MCVGRIDRKKFMAMKKENEENKKKRLEAAGQPVEHKQSESDDRDDVLSPEKVSATMCCSIA